MAGVFEELASLNRLIHEPARLAILTALSSCQSADFIFLQNLTGLTGGNLSSHVSKLEAAGLVQVEKKFMDRRPNTMVELTQEGRGAIEAYWQQLEKMRQKSLEWTPEDEGE